MSAKRQRPSLKRSPLRCPSCIIGGLRRDDHPDVNRPMFKCDRCGHSFTNGKDGGEYAKALPEVRP